MIIHGAVWQRQAHVNAGWLFQHRLYLSSALQELLNPTVRKEKSPGVVLKLSDEYVIWRIKAHIQSMKYL